MLEWLRQKHRSNDVAGRLILRISGNLCQKVLTVPTGCVQLFDDSGEWKGEPPEGGLQRGQTLTPALSQGERELEDRASEKLAGSLTSEKSECMPGVGARGSLGNGHQPFGLTSTHFYLVALWATSPSNARGRYQETPLTQPNVYQAYHLKALLRRYLWRVFT